jgi:hypothetical protein
VARVNFEVERSPDLGCYLKRLVVSRRPDEGKGARAKAEQVVPIPLLPALGLRQNRDEVRARSWRAVEALTEIGYRESPRGRLGKQEVRRRCR